jgi:mono/diheme cytochrome c family protein
VIYGRLIPTFTKRRHNPALDVTDTYSRLEFVLFTTLLLLIDPIISNAQATDDAALYESACAACHGSDGTGRSQQQVAFATPLPDFADCEFASREPDGDWFAIIHEGGPIRAFDQMMPAFGDALTEEEIFAILRHVRTFCADDSWPRGEFNLPRPLFTEKAYPEDETVVTFGVDTGDAGVISSEFLHEKRIGARGMIEVAVPLVARDSISGGGRDFGIGDIALGYKHTVYSDLEKGSIFSVGAEVILPTGDDDKGLGKGTTIIEPFLTYGLILPADMFLQAHAFAEFPTSSGFDDEVGLRLAFGRTWTSGEFGRAWTPMIEALFARDLASSAETNTDLVPQIQVSMNTRQHILVNFGARIPTNNTANRDVQYTVYFLWDWFDGGLFDGW